MAADVTQRAQSESRHSASLASNSPLPDSVRSLLRQLRSRIRRRIVLDGLLLAVLCVLAVFWLGALIDYVPVTFGSNETPGSLRAALLVLMALGVAWAILWRLGRRMLARLSDRSLALLVERRFPQLNNELVTVVELTDKPAADVSNPDAYRSMLLRVHDSVSQHVHGLDPSGMLNWKPVWLIGWATAALLLLTLSMAVAKPDWLAQWASRLFTLSDERWPRLARLQAEGVQLQLPTFTGQLSADRLTIPFTDGAVQVPRGASVTLQILADTTAQQVPEVCTLFYQLADGSRGRANMRRLGGNRADWQAFMLDGPPLVDLTGDIAFDVIGGDARLDDFRVRVVDPAVITAMRLDLTYPAYLLASHSDQPAHEQVDFRSGQRIAEGAQVVLMGTASGPLREVQYVLRTVQSNRRNQTTAPGKQKMAGATSASVSLANASDAASEPVTSPQATSAGDDIQILSAKPNGNEFAIPLGVLRETVVVEIRMLDEYGLASDQIPRYVVTVAEDMQPEVETKLVGIGSAVTPKAVLPISGTARDDHALARVWTTVVVNENPPLEIETEVDADGKLAPRVDLLELSEKHGFKIAPESTLGLVVAASDQFDLAGIKHVGSGAPFQLAVLTEDNLLRLLDRQELELRQRLEMIIDELTQLRSVLREMGQSADGTAASSSAARSALPARGDSVTAHALVAQSTTPVDTADAEPEEGRSRQDPEQARRLTLLRAQQSVLQADKSQQELLGVATRVEDIRLQFINNRIDNLDRQARLHDRVFLPLQSVLEKEMEDFRHRLSQMQSASMSPQGNAPQAVAAADANDRLLVALDGIIANLLDIQSYNEIVDLVRGLLEDEERLLEETQKKQRQDVLESLKILQPSGT